MSAASRRASTLRGWYARILQHEIDHLHGRLYLDHMHSRSFMTVENLNRHWSELPIAEVKDRLGIQSTPSATL